MENLEKKITKMLIENYQIVDALTIEQDAKNDAKELVSLFTESLKGMEAMKMEKDEKVYGLDKKYHMVSSSPRNDLRKEILVELERNTNGK